MTNEQAKKEAIKKAYREYWSLLKDYINENGWCWNNSFTKILPVAKKGMDNATYWKPCSIINIENNNGWTRIEPDGSNLPESGSYNFYNINNQKDDGENRYIFDNKPLTRENFTKWFTHYKPIEKELLPIY